MFWWKWKTEFLPPPPSRRCSNRGCFHPLKQSQGPRNGGFVFRGVSNAALCITARCALQLIALPQNPVQDRQIYIQVVLDDNELFYAVRNRSLPVDVSSDRFPVTTKENPSFHGYGLQNVQTTLAKYHSVYAMDYANGWFEFATDLPNTLIS